MTTILILFAPIPLFILYALIRKRLRQRSAPCQLPAPDAKPYEPAVTPQPNAFLQRFPLTTQLYLRQQWSTARFGFIAATWILTVLLCGSLIPPIANKLPNPDQRVWLSFVTGLNSSSAGLTAFIAIFAALIACTGIIGTTGRAHRTRPIPLRVIFWGRILPALAALLLAAVVSIGIAFTALRVAYGPVWNSVPTSTTSISPQPNVLLNFDDDETTHHAVARRRQWLAQKPAPRILAASITTMLLTFCAFAFFFCQPLGDNRRFSSGTLKWLLPLASIAAVFGFNLLKDSTTSPTFFSHLCQLLFYDAPFQAPPSWRFLPIPIVLSVALLFLSELFYRRRDL